MDNALAIEGKVAEVHYSRANFTKPYVLTMANERKGVRNLRTSFAVSQYFLGTVADSPFGFSGGILFADVLRRRKTWEDSKPHADHGLCMVSGRRIRIEIAYNCFAA